MIADDSLLVREGIASLLRRAGFEISAEASSPDELLAAVEEHRPEMAIVDVRMPPTHTEEGLEAAREIRTRFPHTAIVILSQHVEVGIAMRVLVENPERLGYLLKDRVTDIDDFAATLRHVAVGGSALDPQVVSELLSGRPRRRPAVGPHPARARGARADRRGPLQQGHRRAARRLDRRRAEARRLAVREARDPRLRRRPPAHPGRADLPAEPRSVPASRGGCGGRGGRGGGGPSGRGDGRGGRGDRRDRSHGTCA